MHQFLCRTIVYTPYMESKCTCFCTSNEVQGHWNPVKFVRRSNIAILVLVQVLLVLVPVGPGTTVPGSYKLGFVQTVMYQVPGTSTSGQGCTGSTNISVQDNKQ